MAINKKLISFATQAQFDAYLANNNIDPRSIVFIEDKKRIWTHGVFFDTSWDYVTNKPNTLGGYGITDAYTKAEVDSLSSYVGGYNFTNGFLVKTNVARTENSMLVLHIKGNSYGGAVPINTFVQVYNYRSSDAIINTGALNNGYKINEVKAFYYNNLVYFWVPQQTSFMTMTFQLLKAEGQVNRVDSVINAAVPASGVEKMVTITPRTAWFEDTLTNLSQLTDNLGITSHIANKSNPHSVTKAQVGLGNVLNVASYSKTESDGKYLQLVGGTITGSSYNMLELKRSSAAGSSILFSNSSVNLGKIGFTSNGNLIIGTGTSTDGVANMLSITSSGVAQFYGNISTSGLVIGTGFSKTGATDAHVLLGSGGHKAISDFVPKEWTGAGDGAEIWMKSDVTTAGHSLGLHFTNSTNSTTAMYQSRIQSRRGSGTYSDLIFSIRDTDIMLEILGQDRRVNILNQLTVQNNEVYHTGNLNISNFNASLVTSTSTAGITNVNTTNSNTYLNLIQGTSVASSTQIVGSNGITVSSDTTGKLTITGLGAHAGIYSSRANGLGASSNSIEAKDTRSTNPLPNTDLQRGVWFDFKTNSAIGLTGASTYSSVITMVPYGDNSGNSNASFRLAQSKDNLYFQNWTTVWGTWNKIYHTGNFANGTTDQYIRGDGSLATYSDTTYSVLTAAEASTGTATTARTISAKVLADEINRRGDLRYLSLSGGTIADSASINKTSDSFTQTPMLHFSNMRAQIAGVPIIRMTNSEQDKGFGILSNGALGFGNWSQVGAMSSSWDTVYHTGNLTSLSQLTDNIGVGSHIEDKANPHAVTKAQVGLGNVDNTSDADKPVSIAQQTAINSGVAEAKTYADEKSDLAIPLTQKGVASGVAELDTSGKVPSSQLPSYVDDVLIYYSQSNFPTIGESGKIYVSETTNLTYRWAGGYYVEISPSIALGETSSTAYRGDRGKVAYDHSQTAHAPSNAQKNSDITKAEIEAKLTGNISSHTHSAYVPTSRTVAGKALTSNITLAKGDVGLGNVDNTSDANKPVSTAQAAALALKIDASKFQVVTALPASPATGVFYFIKE